MERLDHKIGEEYRGTLQYPIQKKSYDVEMELIQEARRILKKHKRTI